MAKKKKKDKNKKRQSVDLEAIRLGPEVAALKRKIPRAQWKKIVARAHAQGLTVSSYLDTSTPTPLKERTKSGLRDQAISTVGAAYAPAEADLNTRESRIRSLADKQASDAKNYNDWVRARLDEIDAADTAAQTLRANQARAAQDQLAQQTGAVIPNAMQNVGAQPGVVSSLSGSTSIGAAGQEAQRAVGAGNIRTQSLEALGAQEKSRTRSATANTYAGVAAAEARRVAKTWEALQDVADDRQRLSFEKAAEGAKEIARLFDQEIEKVSANREFAAALKKLDLEAAGLQADIITDRQKAAAKRRDQRIDEARLQGQLDHWSASDALAQAKEDRLAREETGDKNYTAAERKASRDIVVGVDNVVAFYRVNRKHSMRWIAKKAREQGYSDAIIKVASALVDRKLSRNDPNLKILEKDYGLIKAPSRWLLRGRGKRRGKK